MDSKNKVTYFLSDLHLGATYLEDPRGNEARVARFLDSIHDTAQAVYLLGDILDYWYEYKTVVPRGYIRFLGALARLADAGVPVYWMTGNHDVWLFDYLRDEIGLTVLHKHVTTSIMGHEFLLSHGDDVGYQRPMYRFMRMCFNSRVCQVLYAAIHPRWTYAIAHGWSTQNRTHRRHKEMVARIARGVKNLIDFSSEHSQQHPEVKHYVYGHLHTARHEYLATGADVTFLGDWIRQYTYATFDGTQMQLHKYEG
ncbi:MAG: UDP-2,3-diacylglucosamine diphosphatase [Sodaliphilus pleomorphus]|jgi:UDP-2,3-diacylglucosamine hydrolase|uniref:UDP-2,3-diacylglucosamine diphosphatase n=1 Tax=Sodaliphilus pleomorphus TaxID=2606626 RepID=UPI0023F489F5|nr:UDP-2,3-diacylglucosamine diphosphatase [Sodaliphilus pleomorphus]MCI5980170.1 UDP-2,3-diacylglucosamine diphosphatase [Muribaculaceae bacterium]MDY6253199.1 UDP-2,3-diacylglucosamine diphosphatase [Bacteroidales bacterium]MCI6168916.1 UDP-2,3-diacylglucosamine diphosphatase [Muribaculaceae bacterium]MDD6474109.1 UDP-2,3-diacylglucosamine diphosphatase [Sodaliphilus pleomorphus]MDD6687827.1 UDP-2,3-diacylglucosamine diphosphatase [Sodaliphilus pleomorphus]